MFLANGDKRLLANENRQLAVHGMKLTTRVN